MILKSTYRNRIFDWVVFVTVTLFSIFSFINLLSDFENVHAVLFPRIVMFLLSLNAFLSFILPRVNAERMTHLFLGGVLILPSIVPLFKFLVELIFNQDLYFNLLNIPFLYFKLILGSILLYFSIHFTRKKKSKREKNLGIFLGGLGFYVLLFLLVKATESGLKFTTEGFDLWEIIVKIVLGISLVITGMQVRYRKLGYRMGLILTALIFVLFFVL